MPDYSNEDQESRGEEMEGLLAKKDEELAVKNLRIRELEQAMSERDNQIATLKQQVSELDARLSQAVEAYRALVVKANPAVPEELLSGDNIEAIDKSLADAQSLIDKVKQEVGAEIAATRIPAGAPLRTPLDLSVLSPKEKIKYAIGERR